MLQRYLSIAEYWHREYILRFKILFHKTKMLHNQKRALVDKQEKNLQEMKDLYGKRTANFLRGPIMEERKEQFQRWERNNEEYKRQQDREIEESETQMFLNSFSFAKHYLARNEDLN